MYKWRSSVRTWIPSGIFGHGWCATTFPRYFRISRYRSSAKFENSTGKSLGLRTCRARALDTSAPARGEMESIRPETRLDSARARADCIIHVESNDSWLGETKSLPVATIWLVGQLEFCRFSQHAGLHRASLVLFSSYYFLYRPFSWWCYLFCI